MFESVARGKPLLSKKTKKKHFKVCKVAFEQTIRLLKTKRSSVATVQNSY